MKHYMAAAALSLILTPVPAFASDEGDGEDDSSLPVMSEAFVTANTGLDERHLLVPILFLVFIMATASGSDSGAVVVSDERLKTDITRVGTAENGLPLYEFSYIGFDGRFQGVMAQEVLAHTPEAVITHPSGYMMVDYGMLGMEMTRIQ